MIYELIAAGALILATGLEYLKSRRASVIKIVVSGAEEPRAGSLCHPHAVGASRSPTRSCALCWPVTAGHPNASSRPGAPTAAHQVHQGDGT